MQKSCIIRQPKITRRGKPVLEIIISGGWLMVPIILCSIVTIAITVERFWTVTPSKIAPRNLLGQVWNWIQTNQMDSEKLKELRRSSPLGRILAAGLSNSRHGREVMKDSIQEAANQVIHEMERFIPALGTISTVSPLLGLLGTVFGMIEIFNDVMLNGSGNPNDLAGGIGVALITTAGGLCVAIPAMLAHRFFLRRLDGLVVNMEQEAVKLVDALHGERRVDLKTN
jgi:biopolymer transport protein ExbB